MLFALPFVPFFGRIPFLDYLLLFLFGLLTYFIVDYTFHKRKQEIKIEKDEKNNSPESKEVMGSFKDNQTKITCYYCNASWIPKKEPWICPNCHSHVVINEKLSKTDEVMETIPADHIKLECMDCHHIWTPEKKKWYQSQWTHCPNCNKFSLQDDFENEHIYGGKKKTIDTIKVEYKSKKASEMSIEELQEIINAKKLEESKPAAEMSVEELEAVIKVKTPMKAEPKKKPTDAWYIIAFLFAILGGILGYVIAKDDDADMANNLLIVGIISSIFWLFIYLI